MSAKKKFINFFLVIIVTTLYGFNERKAGTNMEEKPNILLILSDDHSAPYLGSYGNPNL